MVRRSLLPHTVSRWMMAASVVHHLLMTSSCTANSYLRDVNPVVTRELQSSLPTIDTIVLNDPNLTTLALAFETARLVGQLCNNCNYTAFAPVNDAFATFDATLLATLLTPSWILHLQNLLAFHVTQPTSDGNRLLSTEYMDGQVFPMLNLENITASDLKRGITLSSPLTMGSKIVEADLLASNGVVQKVDTVLSPRFLGVDVFALGDNYDDFTILQELMDLIELTGTKGEFTILAPTNEAFLALGNETLTELKNDKVALGRVLANHVIVGVYPSIFLVNGLVLESLGGFNITVTVSEATARQAATAIVMFNAATVLFPNILARNGIVHAIDTVIIIDEEGPIISTAPIAMTSDMPSDAPSSLPSDVPSSLPSDVPSDSPSDTPSDVPTSIPSIFDLSELDPDFTVLDELFQLSGLDQLEGELTLLAPVNDAWFALGNDTLARLRNNIDVLGSLLRNHLIAGIITPSDLIGGAVRTTLGGLNVTISPTAIARSIFAAAQQPTMFLFNDALSSDIYYAGNGIIYKIDEVLFDPVFPDTAAPQVPIPVPTGSPVVVVPPPTTTSPSVAETNSPTETPTAGVTPDPTIGTTTLEPTVIASPTSNPSSLPSKVPSNFPSMTPTNVPCSLDQPGVECCVVSDCDGGMSSSIDFVCESNKCIGQGDPRFTLTWFGDDDLDLHVITPNGFEISFSSRNDPTTGGQLDQDDIPSVEGSYVENVFFPLDGSAPNGTYTYFVDNFDQIGLNPDMWTLQVFVGDTLVSSHSGVTENDEMNQMFNYTRL